MTTFESIHYMKLKPAGKWDEVALKVDISTTYDRMRWDFLKAIMQRMGFDAQCIKWIMLCVTTVQYSISMNGNVLATFNQKEDPTGRSHITLLIYHLCRRPPRTYYKCCMKWFPPRHQDMQICSSSMTASSSLGPLHRNVQLWRRFSTRKSRTWAKLQTSKSLVYSSAKTFSCTIERSSHSSSGSVLP